MVWCSTGRRDGQTLLEKSFLLISGIVIRVQGKQPQSVSFPAGDASKSLSYTKTVQSLALRTLAGQDHFPIETAIPINLVPIHWGHKCMKKQWPLYFGIAASNMTSYNDTMTLGRRQQKILRILFENPIRADIEWAAIENLLLALGAELREGRGSRVRIYLNGVRAVFHRPHPQKETDKGAIKSLRRFLTEAGIPERRQDNA